MHTTTTNNANAYRAPAAARSALPAGAPDAGPDPTPFASRTAAWTPRRANSGSVPSGTGGLPPPASAMASDLRTTRPHPLLPASRAMSYDTYGAGASGSGGGNSADYSSASVPTSPTTDANGSPGNMVASAYESRPEDSLARVYAKETLLAAYADLVTHGSNGDNGGGSIETNPLPEEHTLVVNMAPANPLALMGMSLAEREILDSGNIHPDPNKKYEAPGSRGNARGAGIRGASLTSNGSQAYRPRRTGDRSYNPANGASAGTGGGGGDSMPNSPTAATSGMSEATAAAKYASPTGAYGAYSALLGSGGGVGGGGDTASAAGSDVWSTAMTTGGADRSDAASTSAWSRKSRSRSPPATGSRLAAAAASGGLGFPRASIPLGSAVAGGATSTMGTTSAARGGSGGGIPPGLGGLAAAAPVQHPGTPIETWAVQEWYYRDPSGTVQGPFTSDQMQDWYANAYFDLTLVVKATFLSSCGTTEDSGPFVPLLEFAGRFAAGDKATPFLSARYPPPGEFSAAAASLAAYSAAGGRGGSAVMAVTTTSAAAAIPTTGGGVSGAAGHYYGMFNNNGAGGVSGGAADPVAASAAMAAVSSSRLGGFMGNAGGLVDPMSIYGGAGGPGVAAAAPHLDYGHHQHQHQHPAGMTHHQQLLQHQHQQQQQLHHQAGWGLGAAHLPQQPLGALGHNPYLMSGGLRTFDHAAGLGASIQGGAAAGWGQPQMSAAHMLLQQQQQIQQQQQAGIMGLGQWGAGVHDMQAAAAVAAAAAAAAVAAGGSGLGALGGPGFPGQYFMPPRPQVTDPLALSLAAGDSGSTLGHDQMSKGSSSSSAIVAPPATAVVIESSATTTRGRSPSPAKPRSKSPAKVAAMAQKVEEEEVPAAKVDVAATKVRTARTPSPKREAVPAAAVVAAASPAKAPSSAPSTPRKSGKAAKAERKRADAAAAAVTPARAKSPEVQKVTEARPVSPKKQQPEVFAEELPSEDDFAVAEPMPSISAWGLAEDAAAADMWESTFLPTTAGSSSSGRGQSSPSVTASPAQASRTVPASSLSSAAAAAEAPWVKATKPATPKMSMSEIMKLEATKKKAQRANAAASAGAAAATATVIPDISAAWKPAAAGTKSFAEIQAEEAVREAARQRKRQAEAEKLASSIAEVEAMLPLAGKKGWGEVPLVQPVAIADETAALKAAKTKEAQQQQQRAAAATPTMGGFAAAAKKAAGAGSVPAVSGGDSWVVIGAGAKPVKPATPTPTAAAAGTASPKIPAAATAVPRVQAVAPTALMPKVSAAHSRRGINEETAKWATAALKRVPQAAEMVPNLLSMFAEFAIADDSASGTVDSVADIVLQMSTSIDSRAFAAEFVRRRRVDLGMPGTWAVSKSSGSGKQGGGSSSSDTGFVAVGKGKKKGGRK